MAVVLNTNAGFVTIAPTADPAAASERADGVARAMHDVSPATATKITEVGWWAGTATEEANWEIGLYAADGAVVPGEAGTLLYASRTNAKGTTSGWKTAVVDWDISPETDYWIGIQLDATVTETRQDASTTAGTGYDARGGQSTLPDPFGGGTIGAANGALAFYAVWEAGAGSVICINDAFVSVCYTI